MMKPLAEGLVLKFPGRGVVVPVITEAPRRGASIEIRIHPLRVTAAREAPRRGASIEMYSGSLHTFG